MNERHKDYPSYGGRGITVDAAWDSFSRFLGDMGPKPSPELTLERIDNEAGYSAENCCWATRSAQQRNRRPSSEWRRSDG